jgi:hypothetical protein
VLCEDARDEFITIFEALFEFFFCDNRIFDFSPKEMFGQEKSEVFFIHFPNNENINEVICRFSRHILYTTSDDEEAEIMFAFEKIIEFTNSIKCFTKYHLKVGKNGTLKIEGIVFRIILTTRLEDAQIFEIFEFTTDSIDLFIDVSAEFSNKEILLWIKSML